MLALLLVVGVAAVVAFVRDVVDDSAKGRTVAQCTDRLWPSGRHVPPSQSRQAGRHEGGRQGEQDQDRSDEVAHS